MNTHLLFIEAWIFATGFVYQSMEVEELWAFLIAALLAPIAFPLDLGKSLARFLAK